MTQPNGMILQKQKLFLEKITNAKRTKNDLFDLTITVSMEGTPKVSWKEKLKLLNQPETQIYKCFNPKRMRKHQITFED